MKKSFSNSCFRARLSPRDAGAAIAAALLLIFGSIDPALAQTAGGTATSTLGNVFCNLQTNTSNFADLFTAIAFIAGTFFIGNGLYDLVKHHDNPRERPLHHPLLKMSAGGALMALPEVTLALINTFLTTKSGGGLAACTPTTPTSSSATSGSGGVGLDVLIENLMNNMHGPFIYALSTIAIIIGVFLIVKGLMKSAKYNTDPRSHSMTNIVANLSVGALLVVVGQSLDMMLETVFNINQAGAEGVGGATGQSTVGGWNFVTQLNAGTQFTNAIAAALMFFQLIGLIAFIRGWLILKSAAEGSGQATMAQGITHIIGGTIALNIFNFLEIMDHTFGTGFLA